MTYQIEFTPEAISDLRLLRKYDQQMKTIVVPPQAADVNALLEQARDEDILVRAPDGTEFMVTAIDDFDEEIALTRKNARLMALLDERGKQIQTVPLDEVKRQLGL